MRNPILLGFAGRLGSGKDTAIQAIQTFDTRCVRAAFADPVYQAVYQLNPIATYRWFRPVRLQAIVLKYSWEYAKRNYPEIRRLLQYMGTEVGRKLWGSTFWVDKLFSSWDPATPTLISGVRFPEEIEAIKTRGGEIWYIERPDLILESHHQHSSEHVMDKQSCSQQFVNHSIIDLQRDIVIAYDDYILQETRT